jgi:hypothetical protein
MNFVDYLSNLDRIIVLELGIVFFNDRKLLNYLEYYDSAVPHARNSTYVEQDPYQSEWHCAFARSVIVSSGLF